MDDLIKECGGEVALVADVDEKKQGEDFRGNIICAPETIVEKRDCFDYIAVGHLTKYDEIKEKLMSMGFLEDQILMPEYVLSCMAMREKKDA